MPTANHKRPKNTRDTPSVVCLHKSGRAYPQIRRIPRLRHPQTRPICLPSAELRSGFASAVEAILKTNIVLGNTLTDLDSIEWIDYRAGRNGTFLREWSTVGVEGDQLDLFTVRKVDELPVHYSKLAANPHPVLGLGRARA